MHTWRRRALLAWPWLMALGVCAPLLAPGYVLSYDMVWVPDLALRADTVGLGSALPRAVPSDAVVAVLDEVVGGQVLQKLVLVATLGVAGLGALRLWPTDAPVAALATSTVYVWNPYVAERLLLGQWPLLVGYAALPWVVRSAWRLRRGERGSLPPLLLGLAAASMTPASGVTGALLAVVCAHAPADPRRWRRLVLVLGAGLMVNATWLLAGLAHLGAARSDASAVRLFELQPEGVLGRLGAALTLGGVWNTDVVPASRTTVAGALGAVLVLAVLVVGATRRVGWASWPGLLPAGVLGLVLALAGWLVPGVVEELVASVPGGGLLRDGTRYLALLAPLTAVLFGAGIARLAAWTGARRAGGAAFVGVVGLLLPLAALPDLAWGVGGRLSPVAYPASWTRAAEVVASGARPGDVLVVPFTAYRAPAWNDHRPVLDPAGRFFDRETLVNDELVVSGRTIAGEDERAQRLGDLLRSDATIDLAALGFGWVVVEPDAGPVDPRITSQSTVVLAAPEIELREVADDVVPWESSSAARVLVGTGWAVTGSAVIAAAGALLVAGRRRRRTRTERGAESL